MPRWMLHILFWLCFPVFLVSFRFFFLSPTTLLLLTNVLSLWTIWMLGIYLGYAMALRRLFGNRDTQQSQVLKEYGIATVFVILWGMVLLQQGDSPLPQSMTDIGVLLTAGKVISAAGFIFTFGRFFYLQKESGNFFYHNRRLTEWGVLFLFIFIILQSAS